MSARYGNKARSRPTIVQRGIREFAAIEAASSTTEGEIVDDACISAMADVEIAPGIIAAKARDVFRSIRLSCADGTVIERVREHVIAGDERPVMEAMRQVGLESVEDRHAFVSFRIDLGWERMIPGDVGPFWGHSVGMVRRREDCP